MEKLSRVDWEKEARKIERKIWESIKTMGYNPQLVETEIAKALSAAFEKGRGK